MALVAVGMVPNVVADVSRISMGSLIRGVWPFMLPQLILFPSLVTVPARWFYG